MNAAALRAEAAALAARLGQPTRALEDWRYVDLAPLATVPPVGRMKVDVGNGDPHVLTTDGHLRLLPADGVVVSDDLSPFAARLADADDPTLAWALAGDIAALHVSGSNRLIGLRTGATGGASAWALTLHIAPGATADLFIEHHAGAPARVCSWLHLALGAGAVVRVIEHHIGRDLGQRLDTITAIVGKDAQLEWTGLSGGAQLLRQRVEVTLAAPGAGCDLAAADAPEGTLQAHRLTRVRHAAPNTTSRQLIKSVLKERSRTSHDGRIAVDVGADGTDADYQSRSLLLSPDARADSKPQLDINADEVKAAHGATFGQLDAEELLYLRARGLTATAARDTLVSAFWGEVQRRTLRLVPR
jgi:Fe-S cluster assembly protein SufD